MISYTKLVRYLYTVAYYLAIPGLLLRMAWRSIRYNPEYGARWQQRLGYVPTLKVEKVIWIHAVSMGETVAAAPVVRALLARYPDCCIVMTSTTPTGAVEAAKHISERVITLYTPYDLPDCVGRFLNRVHPSLGIILETELWPNLLAACSGRKIPLLLMNACLSARSYQGYCRIAPLAQQMVNSFALVAAQSQLDGDRFLALGLEPGRLQVTGNIKFDIQLPLDLVARGRALRAGWGEARPVWAVASTHEGEEEIILAALKSVRLQFPNILLILIPRHPERFTRVRRLCLQAGYAVALRSQQEPVTANVDILLGDTMGEVLLFYAAADLALVGGSFVPIGGHNLIEPAVLGVPVLAGPYLDNVVDIREWLTASGGAVVIHDADALAATVLELLQNPKKRIQMGENARKVATANAGALEKQLKWIDSHL